MTGKRSGGAAPAVAAGLCTFLVVLGGSYLWMGDAMWPPWVPAAFVVLAGFAATAAAVAVHRAGVAPPIDSRGSAADAVDPHPDADAPRVLARLQVDSGGRKRVLPAERIDWIEAAGNYSRLHVGDRSFLYRMSLGSLVEALGGSRFVRVHKSAAVNLDAVATIDSMSTGDAILHLASGAEVRMSRRYARTFHARTGAVGAAGTAASAAPPQEPQPA